MLSLYCICVCCFFFSSFFFFCSSLFNIYLTCLAVPPGNINSFKQKVITYFNLLCFLFNTEQYALIFFAFFKYFVGSLVFMVLELREYKRVVGIAFSFRLLLLLCFPISFDISNCQSLPINHGTLRTSTPSINRNFRPIKKTSLTLTTDCKSRDEKRA